MRMVSSTRTRAFALLLLAPFLVAGALNYRPASVDVSRRPAAVESPVVGPDPTVVRRATIAAFPARETLPTPTPDLPSITILAAAVTSRSPQLIVRARKGGPVVRDAPSEKGKSLSGLYYDTYLPVYATQPDASGALWYQVRLWGVLTGWIRADQTETGDPPPPTPRPPSPQPARPRPGRSAIFPLEAHGVTTDAVNFRVGAGVDNDKIEVLSPGTPLSVQAWQTDDQSSAWYRVSVGGQVGWVWSGAVSLSTPSPSKVTVGGKPLWSSVAGKGMWMPVPLQEMANPDAVVAAARDLGLTHIYLEVGASGGGFYGRSQADRLVPAAHRAGIKVIGWILTGLNDLPGDEALCTSVATYKTPSGDQLDGIAPDIEDNMDPTDVAAFSQILRARLGSDRLLVGVIYPAGTWIGRQYPIAQVLSQSFNALAPMAYWHDARTTFSSDLIASFIRHSVVDIHDAVDDPNYPVVVIGQTYDAFSRNGAGPNNPTGQEVATALAAARQAGAVGVSLFQWGTTTPAEWTALGLFHWPT